MLSTFILKNATSQTHSEFNSYTKELMIQLLSLNNDRPFKTEEELKYIQIGTKQRANKATRKLLNKWNLGLLHRVIEQKCEENCVYLHYVNPKNTSRTCPKCGSVDKRNRNGESFRCVNCGYEANADLNAAMNILTRFYQEKPLQVDIVPGSAKTNFSDFIKFH